MGRGLILAWVLAGAVLAASTAPAAGADGGVFAPVRIGAAPQYHPAPRWPLAGVDRREGLLADLQGGRRVHIELFANRRVIVVPGGIGVSGGRTELYGNVVHALWRASAWTVAPGGVIHLARDGMRLGDVFDVWGQPLGLRRLLSFGGGDVRAFVNGERTNVDPRAIELHDGDQIVLQIHGSVPPHPHFTFARPRDLLPVIPQSSA